MVPVKFEGAWSKTDIHDCEKEIFREEAARQVCVGVGVEEGGGESVQSALC